jgi:Septum formation
MRGWVFRIGIVAIIAVGALVFRDRLSSNASELKVGDCFDDPVATSGQVVKDVQHHPCTEAHTAEVIFLGPMTGADTAYPADATVGTFLKAQCLPAWQAYTGKDFETEVVLTLGYLMPTQEGWGKGDRDITCYAAREDGAAMTSSVRKTP